MDDDSPMDVPTISQDQQRTIERWTRSYGDETTLPTGTVVTCPSCGQKTLIYTNDLTCDIPRPSGVVTLTRLSGAECRNCGAKVFSASAQKHIFLVRSKYQPAYDAKVTKLSGKQAGLYLPQVVQQNANIQPGEDVKIYITDDGNLFIEIQRHKSGPEAHAAA